MKKLIPSPLGPDKSFAVVSFTYFLSVVLFMAFTLLGKG